MSKNKRSRLTILVAVILALLVLMPLVFTIISASASAASKTSADELKALQNEAEYIKNKKVEIKEQIAANEAAQKSTTEKKGALDEQIQLTADEITNANKQLQQYNVLIAEKQADIDEMIIEEQEQVKHFKERMRVFEESGDVSYWGIIFGASDFADLLDRIDMVNELVESNQSVMDRITALREDLAQEQAELEESKAEQKAVKEELVQLEAEYETQRAEADELMLELMAEKEGLEEYFAQMEAQEAAVASDIDKKLAQIAEEERLAKLNGTSTGYVYGTGSYIWPVSCTTITSRFGYRTHPILGYQKFHAGCDIGASSGSTIWAADSGTVINSGYNSGGYGNYVVIAHGNGYTTLYGHMSSRAVSEGDVVAKGQTIGYVGSTGLSNGPHLHFEIRCNGQYLDPTSFFTNGFTYTD